MPSEAKLNVFITTNKYLFTENFQKIIYTLHHENLIGKYLFN